MEVRLRQYHTTVSVLKADDTSEGSPRMTIIIFLEIIIYGGIKMARSCIDLIDDNNHSYVDFMNANKNNGHGDGDGDDDGEYKNVY